MCVCVYQRDKFMLMNIIVVTIQPDIGKVTTIFNVK